MTDKLFKTKCNLKFIDISNGFSTNFTNVKNIFSNCNSLVSINMTNFSTNYTNMENLFYDFQSLISVDFSNFYSSSNNTNRENLFYNCISLKSVDFPNFYTSSNYINMRYLSLCVALKESKSFSKKLKTLGLLNIIYKKDKRVKLYKFSPVLFFLSLKLKDFLR